jgi:hypothetical protein
MAAWPILLVIQEDGCCVSETSIGLLAAILAIAIVGRPTRPPAGWNCRGADHDDPEPGQLD